MQIGTDAFVVGQRQEGARVLALMVVHCQPRNQVEGDPWDEVGPGWVVHEVIYDHNTERLEDVPFDRYQQKGMYCTDLRRMYKGLLDFPKYKWAFADKLQEIKEYIGDA